MRLLAIPLVAYFGLVHGQSDTTTTAVAESAVDGELLASALLAVGATTGSETVIEPAATIQTTQPEQTGLLTTDLSQSGFLTTVLFQSGSPTTVLYQTGFPTTDLAQSGLSTSVTGSLPLPTPELEYKQWGAPSECEPVGADPGMDQRAYCQCKWDDGREEKCPQDGNVAADFCTRCKEDFVPLLEVEEDPEVEVDMERCAEQWQVGENQMQGKPIENCGAVMTSTESGTVWEYAGRAVATVPILEGTKTVGSTTMTAAGGSRSLVSEILPKVTAMSAYGSPDEETQGVWVGPMTGDNLWFNISSAIDKACDEIITPGTPQTTCAEVPTVTGIPYPKDLGERGKEVKYDGELRLQINEVSFKDATERSRVAYYFGLNAALTLEGLGVNNTCKEVDTSRHNFNVRGPPTTVRSTLLACFIPRDYVLQITDPTGGSNELNTMFWGTYYFTNQDGDVPASMCEQTNNAVNALLAVFTTILSFIPGAGAAGGAAAKGATGAGSAVAQGGARSGALGKAIVAGEMVKTGCKTIEQWKEDGKVSFEAIGGFFGLEEAGKVLDLVLSGGEEDNVFKKNLGDIQTAWANLTSPEWNLQE